MSRTAKVSSLKEALLLPTIAVPVVVGEDGATLSEAIANSGIAIPSSLSAEWCRQQGLRRDVGSTVVLRSVTGPTIVLISLGDDDQ